jgi:hypothetical protein
MRYPTLTVKAIVVVGYRRVLMTSLSRLLFELVPSLSRLTPDCRDGTACLDTIPRPTATWVTNTKHKLKLS